MRHEQDETMTHLFADLYRVAAPSWQEYAVASLDGRRDDLALLVRRTGTDRNDGSLGQRSAGRGCWQEDAAGSFLRHAHR